LALDQGRLDDIVEQLTAMPHVLEIHATTGREDLLVRLGSTSHAELQELIQRIVGLPGVSHSDTKLALTTPLPYRVQPLLTHLTRAAGFGRSTPLVRP
jgi:DNA-binding Lrp family transcriptional regulator